MRIVVFILLITILSGVLLTLTPIHTVLFKKAEMNELPVIGGIYEAIYDSHETEGVLRGYVTSIHANSLVISHNDSDNDTDDGVWNVILPSGPNTSEHYYVGEKVYVAGKINGDNIYAYGIHDFFTDDQMK
jgi:hypothetical protein